MNNRSRLETLAVNCPPLVANALGGITVSPELNNAGYVSFG